MFKKLLYFILPLSVLYACSDDPELESRYLGKWKSNCIAGTNIYTATLYEFSYKQQQYQLSRVTKRYTDADCTVEDSVVIISEAPGPYTLGDPVKVQGNLTALQLDYKQRSVWGDGNSYVDYFDIVVLVTDPNSVEPDVLYFGNQPAKLPENRPTSLELSRIYTRLP